MSIDMQLWHERNWALNYKRYNIICFALNSPNWIKSWMYILDFWLPLCSFWNHKILRLKKESQNRLAKLQVSVCWVGSRWEEEDEDVRICKLCPLHTHFKGLTIIFLRLIAPKTSVSMRRQAWLWGADPAVHWHCKFVRMSHAIWLN